MFTVLSPKPTSQLSWSRVLCLAALVVSILLMHGITSSHDVHTQCPVHSVPGHTITSISTTTDVPLAGLASAGLTTAQASLASEPGADPSEHDPGLGADFAQACLAILAFACLLAHLLLGGRPSWGRFAPSRWSIDSRPTLLSTLKRQPSLHVLCVMRT